MGAMSDSEASQISKDLKFQEAEAGRTFKWLAALGLATIGAGLVWMFGLDYAQRLATGGTALGVFATSIYAVYRVISGRVIDVHD